MWSRRFYEALANANADVLPYGRLKHRRAEKSANASLDTLKTRLARCSLESAETLAAAMFVRDLPRRKLEDTIFQAIFDGGLKKLDVYSERWQGRSLFLAQLACRMSERRAVIYWRWPDVKKLMQAGRQPSHFWLGCRWAVVLRFPMPCGGVFRTPWLVLDDCPTRVEADHEELADFLKLLDDAGICYIVGVRRYRQYPVDDYTGWCDKGFKLTLEDDEELVAIAEAWLGWTRATPAQIAQFNVPAWAQTAKRQYKKHLVSMLILLDRDFGQEAPAFEDIRKTWRNVTDEDRLVLQWISVGQLVDVGLPHALVEKAFPNVIRAVERCYDGLIRRDTDRLEHVIYHMGGPIIASEILSEELKDRDKLTELLRLLMNRSLTSPNVPAANYWRRVLHRLVSRWNPLLDDIGGRKIARDLYREFKEKLPSAPDGSDDLTTLSWAASLRKLGDADASRGLYRLLLDRPHPREPNDLHVLFNASLLIGIADVLPEMLFDQRCLDIAEELTKIADESARRRLRLSLGLANVFYKIAEDRKWRLAPNNASDLLCAAERLARTATGSPRFKHSAYHMLARLIGLHPCKYKYDDKERPDFQEARHCALASFESSMEAADDDARKTWQDVLAHHVLGLIYQRKYRETKEDECLEEADAHFRRSFVGLDSRKDIGDASARNRQFLDGASRYALFLWKTRKDFSGADSWYAKSIAYLEGLSADERPPHADKYYRYYQSFREQTGYRRLNRP